MIFLEVEWGTGPLRANTNLRIFVNNIKHSKRHKMALGHFHQKYILGLILKQKNRPLARDFFFRNTIISSCIESGFKTPEMTLASRLVQVIVTQIYVDIWRHWVTVKIPSI